MLSCSPPYPFIKGPPAASGPQRVSAISSCTAALPESQLVELPGFQTGIDYYISWFPTRMNTTVCPDNDEDLSGSGTVTLDLTSETTEPFVGTFPYHLDTLHSDYAFIIATSLVKNLPFPPPAEENTVEAGWDFLLFPNPARGEMFIRFSEDTPKEIMLLDLSGRLIQSWNSETNTLLRLSLDGLAKGVYYLRGMAQNESKTKKLIIH